MFAYGLLYTRLEARDLSRGLRFTDTLLLEPGQRDPRRIGLLAGRSDLGTLYVLTRAIGSGELAGTALERSRPRCTKHGVR